METLHVLVARSCAGKDYLAERLIATGEWGLTISATTREPRAKEVDGVSYHFMNRDQFIEKVSEGMFLEHAEFSGKMYGTPATEIQRISDEGKIPLAIVEPKGAKSIAQWCKDQGRPLSLMTINADLATVTKRFSDRFRDEVEKAKDSGVNGGRAEDSIVESYAKRFKASLFEEESWHRLIEWSQILPVTSSPEECGIVARQLTDWARDVSRDQTFTVPSDVDYDKDGNSGSAKRYQNRIEKLLKKASSNPKKLGDLFSDIQSVQDSFICKYGMKPASQGMNP